MCGRFALYADPGTVARALRLPPLPNVWQPGYNVAPGTWITGVLRYSMDGDPMFDEIWWGYRPQWTGHSGPAPINARAERLDSSRYFRGAFHKHRCLIPADGWYEWMPAEGGKQPWFITRADRQPLFLGGIWAPFDDDTACCAIITELRSVARRTGERLALMGIKTAWELLEADPKRIRRSFSVVM